MKTTGSLTVVGTGIAVGQITAQVEGEIHHAEVVLALIPDPACAALVRAWAREYEDLARFYVEGKPRPDTYAEITARVMQEVRSGKQVCLALYGHPGVLAAVTRMAMRAAREEGYLARMLPGISAEACLYADVGVDPGEYGAQSHLASRFLRNGKSWDPTSLLILWQIGLVGDDEHHENYPNKLLPDLLDKLIAVYGPHHEAVLYEAATLPLFPPRIERIPLADLIQTRIGSACTLLIEPAQ